jgi:mannose-6-phosphate isomerase-like protein (cupin superfamily)
MKSAILVVGALALAITAAGQQTPAPAPTSHNPVILFPTPDLHARLDALLPDAKKNGSSGSNLADYGSYKIGLSVRTASEGAEIHANWDDVMVVEQGSATLITGGTVVDGKTGADGETRGAKIEGGQSRVIHLGDVFTIRAGTPHQLILEPGTVYSALVIKVHEPSDRHVALNSSVPSVSSVVKSL